MRYRSAVLLLLVIELHSSSCTHLVIPCILRVLYNGEGRFMTRILNNSGQRQLQALDFYYFICLLHKVSEKEHNDNAVSSRMSVSAATENVSREINFVGT
jgi:hypothetical protein